MLNCSAHWDEVEAAWPDIVNAFKKAFSRSISGNTIESDFLIAKVRFQQDYIRNRDAQAMALACGTTASRGNHISIAEAMQILHRGRTIAIYASHYENTAMVVISIPRGTTAHISRNLASRNLVAKDVSLGKLYVLYNTSTRKYFHMHVSLFRDDTHYLREANGLCYQLAPTFSYDQKYDHPRRPLNMPINNNW